MYSPCLVLTLSCTHVCCPPVCDPGFYCEEGASTGVPCPAGTSAGARGQSSQSQCIPVPVDFWAPLGSAAPEQCPPSGFYCPGALADTVNEKPGSKPILFEQGGSTQKQTQVRWPLSIWDLWVMMLPRAPCCPIPLTQTSLDRHALLQLVASKEITLAMSTEDYEPAAVKLALAALYGVSIEQISLASSAGSVKLTMSISESAAGGPSLEDVLAQVNAVDDATLGASLGDALGFDSLVVSSTAAKRDTVVSYVPFDCPEGQWCTAGIVVNCTERTYNPLRGMVDG